MVKQEQALYSFKLAIPNGMVRCFSSEDYLRKFFYITICAEPCLKLHNAEILEFDAMDEPPSVLDVEVFDFDGPFDQATSLGHAEIIFLKHTSPELADMWIPLEGKLAQSSQSKLHLRIFIDNDKGVETVKEYLTKMEKEVGRKVNTKDICWNNFERELSHHPCVVNCFTLGVGSLLCPLDSSYLKFIGFLSQREKTWCRINH